LISTANSTSTNFSFSHKKWKKLICRLTSGKEGRDLTAKGAKSAKSRACRVVS
jgi:hypothetical protein